MPKSSQMMPTELYVIALDLVVSRMPLEQKAGRAPLAILEDGEALIDRMRPIELLSLISKAHQEYVRRERLGD